MNVRFEKWEGLGNDFVLVEGPPLPAAAVRWLCDRRRGVGGDGALFVEDAGGERPTMTVLNADGTRPEMCGNGVRCVAAFVAGRRGVGEGTIEVATDAGVKACAFVVQGDGAAEVTVDMGPAVVVGELSVDVHGALHRFTTVDVGNPHAVTFEAHDERGVELVGPRASAVPPSGFNVEICRASPGRVDVVVWERGVGRTFACGTGACAVAAVACANGLGAYGEPLVVGLPGGDLVIVVDAATHHATMRGPARRAFRGEAEVP
jgi:diaminopimelate epimerase